MTTPSGGKQTQQWGNTTPSGGKQTQQWGNTTPSGGEQTQLWDNTTPSRGEQTQQWDNTTPSGGKQTQQWDDIYNSFGRQTNPAVGNKIYLLCHNLVNFAKINSRTPDYLCKQYKQLCISINALMKVVPGSIYNQVSIDCNASSDKELSVSQINLLKCVGNH